MTSAVCEVKVRVLSRGNGAHEVGESVLYLSSYAQLRLFLGSHLEFIWNSEGVCAYVCIDNAAYFVQV